MTKLAFVSLLLATSLKPGTSGADLSSSGGTQSGDTRAEGHGRQSGGLAAYAEVVNSRDRLRAVAARRINSKDKPNIPTL
jgi:hypothetical protein